MNKLSIILLALIASTTTTVKTKIGCIDNSKHLTERFDTKSYHYVECHCPCIKMVADRNKCIECFHYHEGQKLILVPTSDEKKASTTSPEIPSSMKLSNNMQTVMTKLVTHYKQEKYGIKP